MGTLVTVTDCKLLVLDAHQFMNIAAGVRQPGHQFHAEIYGREFCELLNANVMQEELLSDLLSMERLRRLAARAFGVHEALKRKMQSEGSMASVLSSKRGEVDDDEEDDADQSTDQLATWGTPGHGGKTAEFANGRAVHV